MTLTARCPMCVMVVQLAFPEPRRALLTATAGVLNAGRDTAW